jgi:hypothetical protein
VVPTNVAALEWLRNHLEAEGSDVLREMIKTFAEVLMSAEADGLCGAGYGQRSPDRVTKRNGYRTRDFERPGLPSSNDSVSALGVRPRRRWAKGPTVPTRATFLNRRVSAEHAGRRPRPRSPAPRALEASPET